MLRHVIEKELKDCVYGYRSLLVFVLSSVLFVVSTYTGAREYQAELQEFRLNQVALRQRFAEETNLYTLSVTNLSFAKPPPVLRILVNGVEPYTPHVYSLSLYLPPEPEASPASQNPTGAVSGTLDVLFIVEVVLGLAALLFTFSAVCGEKEAGTLRLQLANALPKDTLLLGKLAGNLVGLLVPVAVSFLLACLMFTTFSGVALSGEEVLRVLLLGADFFLYLAGLFALGLCISTLTTRATTSFALCLVVWVFLVAIVPKLASIAAIRISPLESLQEFEMKKAQVYRQGTLRLQKEYWKYLHEHNRQPPPRDVYEAMLAQVRNEQNRAYAGLEQDYLQRQERQAQMARLLSRLSPAGSASYAAMALARTGAERDFHFQSALRDYRSEFATYYDRKSRELIALAGKPQGPLDPVEQNFTDLALFEFHEEGLTTSMEHTLPDLGLLAVWALVFFAVAYFRFLRYDVR